MIQNQDPRDEGTPGVKEWLEFRASFAIAMLFVWIVDDLDEIAPGYIDDIRNRIETGFDISESLSEEDPEENSWVPIPAPYDQDYTQLAWWTRQDAEAFYDQLFPSALPNDERQAGLQSLAVVGIHSALETYAIARGAGKHGPLPRRIARLLSAGASSVSLSADVYESLIDLDATRHIVVHNRGVVDEPYMRSVAYTQRVIGEFRFVTPPELRAFSQSAWNSAVLLREVNPSAP